MQMRDTVWERSDGVRVRMSVQPGSKAQLDGTGYTESQPSVMTLSAFGGPDDGVQGETFTLVGSVPRD